MPFLQPLERCDHLLAVAVAAGPQPQLPPARTFDDRELDPELRDRSAWLPLLNPGADEAEELDSAAEWMAHYRVAFLGVFYAPGRFEKESNPHMLGAGTAQAELIGKVAAERSGDEEQSLAVLDWWLELAMRAGELRWSPRRELIRLEAAREEDGVPPRASELALQLALAESCHRAKRSQAEQVQALELFIIERELMR